MQASGIAVTVGIPFRNTSSSCYVERHLVHIAKLGSHCKHVTPDERQPEALHRGEAHEFDPERARSRRIQIVCSPKEPAAGSAELRDMAGRMTSYRNALALLRGQLWPVPGLFVLGAIGLAYVLLSYGTLLTPDVERGHWWLYSGEASTGRDLLSSLLSGLMTMTSLVVSVTFVILTLAANQLGPRLISIFMGDRQIQSVLGLFIGTILYVILVLRTLDDTLGSNGVPHLAITAASALTISCLLALLFYIHKVARSIIADNVIESVARHFRHTLRDILPDQQEPQLDGNNVTFHGNVWVIGLCKDGYLQVVDYKQLAALACENDLRIDVKVRAGQHILRRGEHVAIFAAGVPGEELCNKVRSAFTIGAERTPAQDPEHGIRQLVEIATRALSPGINDLFSAVAVIDSLGSVFEEIFSRHPQPRLFADSNGDTRVIASRNSVSDLLEAALQPIRQSATQNPLVLAELAGALAKLTASTRDAEQRNALQQQVIRLVEVSSLASFAKHNKLYLLEEIARAQDKLAVPSADRLRQ